MSVLLTNIIEQNSCTTLENNRFLSIMTIIIIIIIIIVMIMIKSSEMSRD